MNVRFRFRFAASRRTAWQEMRTLGARITSDPQSVRVVAEAESGVFTVECAIRHSTVTRGVDRFDRMLRDLASDEGGAGECLSFAFVPSELEAARAARRNALASERRRRRRLEAQAAAAAPTSVRDGENSTDPPPPPVRKRPLRPKPAPPPPKPTPRVHPSRRGPDVILYVDPLSPPEEK